MSCRLNVYAGLEGRERNSESGPVRVAHLYNTANVAYLLAFGIEEHFGTSNFLLMSLLPASGAEKGYHADMTLETPSAHAFRASVWEEKRARDR